MGQGDKVLNRGVVLNLGYLGACKVNCYQHLCASIVPYSFSVYHVNKPVENPTLYRKKLGLQVYSLLFLFWLENINYEYSLEPQQRGGLTSTYNLYLKQA